MAISDTITSIEDNLRADYEGLENIGGDITGINKNILNIRTILDNIYNDLPKVTGEGTEVTLTPTRKGRLALIPKGNSTQESTTGANLCPPLEKGKGLNVTTGEEIDNGGSARTDFIPVDFTTNPNYYLSGIASTLSTYMFAYNSNKEFLGRTGRNRNTYLSFNSSSFAGGTPSGTGDVAYVRLLVFDNGDPGSIDDIDTWQVMLNTGNSAEPYEQYTNGPAPNPSYPFPIKSVTGNNNVVVNNKNLFNGILEIGIINGTTGQDQDNNNYVRTKDYIPVKELTSYVISTPDTVTGNLYIYEYKADYTYNLTTNISKAYGVSWVTQEDTAYVRFRPGMQTTDTSLKFQLEQGSTATDYVPYGNQTKPLNLGTIELNGIGDYKDKIFKAVNGNAVYDSLTSEQKALLTYGKWYKHEEIGKVVFNGTETWQLRNTSANGTKTYSLNNTPPEYYLEEVNVSPSGMAYCDKFIVNQTVTGVGFMYTQGVLLDVIGLDFYYNPAALDTRVLYINTKETLPTYLENNNAKLIYKKATATDIEITDQTLISQLEEINKMKSYEGTTIITSTYDSNNSQMIISASGLKGE